MYCINHIHRIKIKHFRFQGSMDKMFGCLRNAMEMRRTIASRIKRMNLATYIPIKYINKAKNIKKLKVIIQ